MFVTNFHTFQDNPWDAQRQKTVLLLKIIHFNTNKINKSSVGKFSRKMSIHLLHGPLIQWERKRRMRKNDRFRLGCSVNKRARWNETRWTKRRRWKCFENFELARMSQSKKDQALRAQLFHRRSARGRKIVRSAVPFAIRVFTARGLRSRPSVENPDFTFSFSL